MTMLEERKALLAVGYPDGSDLVYEVPRGVGINGQSNWGAEAPM